MNPAPPVIRSVAILDIRTCRPIRGVNDSSLLLRRVAAGCCSHLLPQASAVGVQSRAERTGRSARGQTAPGETGAETQKGPPDSHQAGLTNNPGSDLLS